MPYLIAATRADAMLAALATLEGLRQPKDLEDFFVAQAKSLGMVLEQVDRETYREPTAEAVENWIADQLVKAANLRRDALDGQGREDEEGHDPTADYAISTWVWLGRIFARTSPSFWQGRNRWLGGAAFPDAFTVQTNVMSVATKRRPTMWDRIGRWLGVTHDDDEDYEEASPELARFLAASQEQTRKQLASKSVQRLRGLLVSTASLSPALSVPSWESSLPKEGGGNLVSGAVAHDALDELVNVLREAQGTEDLPYETGDEWVEIVVAAARWAKDAGAHLVEGDDSIYGAYRWPAIDE
jgi:hypothetical protein